MTAMRENNGEFQPERETYISTVREELEDLSDEISTNELPENEPIDKDEKE